MNYTTLITTVAIVSVAHAAPEAKDAPEANFKITNNNKSLTVCKSCTQTDFEKVCQKYPEVDELDIEIYSKITNLSPIEKLKNLKSLSIAKYSYDKTKKADLSPIKSMSKLSSLKLNRLDIQSLAPIENLAGLTNLSFYHINSKQDHKTFKQHGANDEFYAPISKLQNITHLTIFLSDITNINFIKNCNEIKSIDIHSAPALTDISALTGKTKVEIATFSYSNLSSIKPLLEMSNLKEVKLHGNKISSSEIEKLKSKNPKVDIGI